MQSPRKKGLNEMKILVIFSLILISLPSAFADYSPTFYKGMTYEAAKKEYFLFMAGNSSNEQKLAVIRNMVKASKVGERGLNKIHKNFDGDYKINVNTPGVDKLILMMFSGSTAQRKGYQRELLVFQHLSNDERFSDFKIGDKLNRKWGKTDADISFKHIQTGKNIRIEVKDYITSSQKTNISNLKRQIDKMSKEKRYYKTTQVWMNHHEVLPELKAYAESKGIMVIDNVKTGLKSKGLNIKQAADIIHQRLTDDTTSSINRSGSQTSFLITNKNLIKPSSIRLSAIKMPSFSLGTFARFAGGDASSAYSVFRFSRYATEYASGSITRRAMISSAISYGSDAAGGVAGCGAGALAGGAVGSVVPVVGTAIGAILGGIAGSLIGSSAGDYAGSICVDQYHKHLSDIQDEKLGKFIYAYYGVNQI